MGVTSPHYDQIFPISAKPWADDVFLVCVCVLNCNCLQPISHTTGPIGLAAAIHNNKHVLLTVLIPSLTADPFKQPTTELLHYIFEGGCGRLKPSLIWTSAMAQKLKKKSPVIFWTKTQLNVFSSLLDLFFVDTPS